MTPPLSCCLRFQDFLQLNRVSLISFSFWLFMQHTKKKFHRLITFCYFLDFFQFFLYKKSIIWSKWPDKKLSLGVSKWLKAFRNTIVVRKCMYLIPNWKKKIHRTLFCEIMNKKLRKTIFFFKKYTSVSKSANPKAQWTMVVKNFFLC